MNSVDWFVIITVGIAALHGFFRGWIKETAHVLAWLIGLFAAWRFGRFLDPWFTGLSAVEARLWAERAVVVAAMLAAGAVAGTVLAHQLKPGKPHQLDGPLGAGIGALRGILVLGVLVLLGQALHVDDVGWWRKSRLLPYGEAVADGVRMLVGEERVHRRHLVDLHRQGLRGAMPAKAA